MLHKVYVNLFLGLPVEMEEMIKAVFTVGDEVDNTDPVLVEETTPIPFIKSISEVIKPDDLNEIKPVSSTITTDESNNSFRSLLSKVRDHMDKQPNENFEEASVLNSKDSFEPVLSTSNVLSQGRGSFFGYVPGARLVPAGSRVVDSTLDTNSAPLDDHNLASVHSNAEQVIFDDEIIVPGSFSSSRSNIQVQAPVHDRTHVEGSKSSKVQSNEEPFEFEEESIVPGTFTNDRSNILVQAPVDIPSSSRTNEETIYNTFDEASDYRNNDPYAYYEPSQYADYDTLPVSGSFSSDSIEDEYTLSSYDVPGSVRTSQTYEYGSDLSGTNYDSYYLPGSVRINSDSSQYSVDYAQDDSTLSGSFRSASRNIGTEPAATPPVYDPYNNNPYRTAQQENRQVLFHLFLTLYNPRFCATYFTFCLFVKIYLILVNPYIKVI